MRRDETNEKRREKLLFGKGGIIIIGRGREKEKKHTDCVGLSLSLEMMMMSVRRVLSILGLVAGRYTEFFFRR